MQQPNRPPALKGAFFGAACLAAWSVPAAAQDITLHALMEDVPETQIIEQMLPQFEKQTGIDVEFDKLGYPDMHDKLVTQLVSSDSYYNLLEVDFLWAGEFPAAGWLTDLRPYVEKTDFDLDPFIPSMMRLLNGSGDPLYILPMYNYSMGLIYRKDLLNDPKLQKAYKSKTGKTLAKPETLENYVAISKFMKANADVAGAAMQGQRGDPNSLEFSNYLFAAGGQFLDSDGKVALDSKQARKALDLYIDNIRNGAQKGALSATLDDTLRLMCNGKAFSMITYWWMLPQVDDQSKCPEVAGKVGLSVMPGGHGESGGWGWGIPKNVSSKEKDAAWKFIQWVQGKKVAIRRALKGHAPVRNDVFSDEKVLEKYPYYADAQKIVDSGRSFPVFTYSAQYENVLGTQLSSAASGSVDPKAALKAASEGLTELMNK